MPLLVYIFVKRNVNKKRHDRCTFASIITIIREVQAQGFVIGQQTAPLKHERSQGHTSAIHHTPINIYEYAVNKHACSTNVTLQSVAI